MEEDYMLGAQAAQNADETKMKRKRRRSPVEVIDLSEAASPSHPSLRHLPRLRVSPPKQNQPEPNLKHLPQPQESPIYLDDEPGPSKQTARQSRSRRNTAATTATTAATATEPVISPRRSSLRASVPHTRRSRWGEIQDTIPSEQTNNINNNNINNNNNDGDDGFLARRLQAEEELRVARQRRALEYRMQELERAEEESLAAVAAGDREEAQPYHYQPGRRHYSRHSRPADEPSPRSRAYSNSRRLFSNSSGRYGNRETNPNPNNTANNEEVYPPAAGRRRRGGGGRTTDPVFGSEDISAEAVAAAMAPPTGPRSGPRQRRGWPRHNTSTPMGFSDAMSEYFRREMAAEAEMAAAFQAAAWNREHTNEGNDSMDEVRREYELWEGRSRMGPAVERPRGPGRPREGHRHPFSSFIGELAALHQAVLGARSSALPSELLFSDRDFTEADYEALLALDEGVENRKGAKQDVINQLHSERVPRGGPAQAVAAAYGDCCICLDRIGAGQVVRKLECSHHFHKGCVDKWLKQKASCPICQRKIV